MVDVAVRQAVNGAKCERNINLKCDCFNNGLCLFVTIMKNNACDNKRDNQHIVVDSQN